MKVIQLTLALLSVVALIECGIVLTGNADVDFAPSNSHFTADEKGAIGTFQSINNFSPPDYMTSRGRQSGMDVAYVRTFYDWKNDKLYVGLECKGICGDTDGNGDPSTLDTGILTSLPSFKDDADGCTTESFALFWWNNVPNDYVPADIGNPNVFFPQFITADTLGDCIVDSSNNQHFETYEMPNYKKSELQWANAQNEDYNNPILSNQRKLVQQPDQNGAYVSSLKYSSTHPELPGLQLFAKHTSASAPHIEFVLANFSKYPGNEYMTPGSGYFRTALKGFFYASQDDPMGEDSLDPNIWDFSYDCKHVPGGSSVYDVCGVCGGDGSSCADCKGVPLGKADYDKCGVCDGNGESCECHDYLGFELDSVDYALLRWSVSASLSKINDTLDVLKSIRSSLRDYDYSNGDVSLNDYIDVIHEFCDNCLDSFDDAQLWFTEIISGACDGLNCDSPFENQVRWSF